MKKISVLILVFFGVFLSFSIFADDENNPRGALDAYDPSVDQSSGTHETPEVATAVSSGATDSAVPPKKRTVNVRTSLNVRAGPWGRIIGTLHNNDEVVILGKEGDWLKIKFGDSFGYVHSDYIRTAEVSASSSASGSAGIPARAQTATVPTATDSLITLGSGTWGGPPFDNMPARTGWEFGLRNLGNGIKMHGGIDITCPMGTPLKAMGGGYVIRRGNNRYGGNFVIVRYDNGVESKYCHLQAPTDGSTLPQRVEMGDVVGSSDTTGQSDGPHLHLVMAVNGQSIDPRRVPGINLPNPRSRPAY